MSKFWLGCMAAIVLSLGAFMPVEVGAEGLNEDVELTEEQKVEMAALQMEALETHKEIIHKYVEYGVLTEEKGQQIITHLEKRFEDLEKNGFVPKWDKQKTHDQEEDA